MKNLAPALLKAQLKVHNAKKDAKNPHFDSDYASLESVLDAVKPIANEYEIAITQTGGKDQEGHFIETQLIHVPSAECISSRVYLVLDKQNMQGLGSAISYARRYSLAALFAIGQADDDANTASQSHATIGQRREENQAYSPPLTDQEMTQELGNCGCGAPLKWSEKKQKPYCPNWEDKTIKHKW